MSDLVFRPHHFLCSIGFRGKGYSPAFVRGFYSVLDRLEPETKITVRDGVDTICDPCPKRDGSQCEKEESIRRLDSAHAHVLGLKDGIEISWGEAKGRIREKMSLEDFERVCASCSWKSLGYCREALENLKKCT